MSKKTAFSDFKFKEKEFNIMSKNDAKTFISGLLVIFGIYLLYTAAQFFYQNPSNLDDARLIVFILFGALFVLIPSYLIFKKK